MPAAAGVARDSPTCLPATRSSAAMDAQSSADQKSPVRPTPTREETQRASLVLKTTRPTLRRRIFDEMSWCEIRPKHPHSGRSPRARAIAVAAEIPRISTDAAIAGSSPNAPNNRADPIVTSITGSVLVIGDTNPPGSSRYELSQLRRSPSVIAIFATPPKHRTPPTIVLVRRSKQLTRRPTSIPVEAGNHD